MIFYRYVSEQKLCFLHVCDFLYWTCVPSFWEAVLARWLLRGGSRACKPRLRVRAWWHASFLFSRVFCFPVFLLDPFFPKISNYLENCLPLVGAPQRAFMFMHACACACTLFYFIRDLAESMHSLGCLVLLLFLKFVFLLSIGSKARVWNSLS